MKKKSKANRKIKTNKITMKLMCLQDINVPFICI